jgi:hypothetical protein
VSVINDWREGRVMGIETEYNGQVYRSRMEANCARLLHWMTGEMPEYEPKSFLLPNGEHYCPDFRMKGTSFETWVECRGYEGKDEQLREFAELLDVDFLRRDAIHTSFFLVLKPNEVMLHGGADTWTSEFVWARCEVCNAPGFFRPMIDGGREGPDRGYYCECMFCDCERCSAGRNRVQTSGRRQYSIEDRILDCIPGRDSHVYRIKVERGTPKVLIVKWRVTEELLETEHALPKEAEGAKA